MREKLLKKIISLVFILLIAGGCEERTSTVESTENTTALAELPYIGEFDVQITTANDGSKYADTVQYSIPKFSFTNQFGKTVSHRDYEGKIFVAEFFFTTCTSICPIMSANMVRLQALTKKEGLQNDVWFLSHSVKPLEDTPDVLLKYGENIGADFSNWNFVTGNATDIFEQAQEGYLLTAFPSDTAQGGVFHTDKLALIDRAFHIRGIYDGTTSNGIDQLLQDIQTLKNEYGKSNN